MLATSVRRRSSLLWFVVGLLVGGLLTATVMAILGAPVQALLGPAARWTVVALVAVTLVLRAGGYLPRFPLPQNRRLVPETVFLNGPTLPWLQFGVEMGCGVRTYVTSAIPYVLAVAVVCVASPAQAWAAGAGFGTGRALMTWASARGQDPSTWRARWMSTGRMVAGLLGASVAVGLAVLALGSVSV